MKPEPIAFPPGFPIEAPDNPAAQYAAGELARVLKKMDGHPHPVVQRAAGFCLRLMLRQGSGPDGSFALQAQKSGVAITAPHPSGLVYGAYALLEEWGCRFLAADCETVPDTLRIAAFERSEQPAFHARELFWREAMDGVFTAKLRLNSARSALTEAQGGKMMFYNFSHTFNRLVPVERWFDTHPEYFSEINGVRQREKTQLCLTNEAVLALAAEGVLKWKKENPSYTIFSVAMNDWYSPCDCPACRAVDEKEGGHAGAMIRFVNAVAERVTAVYPDVYIHTFAYLYCRKPPRQTRPHPHVIVRLCPIECCYAHPMRQCAAHIDCIDVQAGRAARFAKAASSAFAEDMKGWAAITDNLYIWDYGVNYAHYLLPFPNFAAMQDNLRFYRDMGVKGVFAQGNFAPGRASALAQLKIYLLGRLLWNPDADVNALTDDFVRGYYREAAFPMRRYAALWQENTPHHAGIYDEADAPYLGAERLSKAKALLDEALTMAQTPETLERIQREALSVRYALLAQAAPQAPRRAEEARRLIRDAERLGITELHERKEWTASARLLEEGPTPEKRHALPGISYPI